MTYADAFNIRTSNVKFNDVADALDGVLSRANGNVTTGSATAYASSPTPAWAAYDVFRPLTVAVHATNTGAATLNVSGLGARNMTYLGYPLVGGELVINRVATFVWDGGAMALVSPHGGGWATWTPGYGASGGMTYKFVSTEVAKYQRHGRRVVVLLQARGTTDDAPAYRVHATMPIACANVGTFGMPAAYYEGGLATRPGWCEAADATTFGVTKTDTSNWTLGPGRLISVRGEYEV